MPDAHQSASFRREIIRYFREFLHFAGSFQDTRLKLKCKSFLEILAVYRNLSDNEFTR